MTVKQNDVTMRPMTGREDLDLYCQLPYVLNKELANDLDAGRRRPEWMWMALQVDHLVARLAWWTAQAGSDPFLLDVFDIDDSSQEPTRVNVGVGLLRTAMATTLPASALARRSTSVSSHRTGVTAA